MKYLLPAVAVIFTVIFVSAPLVWSGGLFEWGEHEEHEEYEHGMRGFSNFKRDYEEYERRSTGVVRVQSPLYAEECGSCHMAYPPGLLPAISWEKVMLGLEDHFGDNAELDDEAHQAINKFLIDNSSDNSKYRRSQQFGRLEQMDNVRIRITEAGYFKHEHNEIPLRMVTDNPEVKSFSHCNTCHIKAEQGSFNEHDIQIPGFGRWDD